MHLKWHLAVPSTAVACVYSVDAVIQTLTLGDARSLTLSLTAALAFGTFILGSVAPDVSALMYKVAGWANNRTVILFDSRTWDARHTRLFAALDRASTWPIFYKFLHSIAGSLVLFCILFATLPQNIALAYTLGHCLHLAMDWPTHRTSWLLWPCVRLVWLDPKWDWWRNKTPDP